MTTATEPKRRRGGAPAENRNGFRHGLRSARDPKGCVYITQQGTRFRQSLEDRLIADGREIGPYEAGLIAAGVAHLKHAAKARRWLRVHFDELTYDQRLAFSREEPKSLDSLARCMKELGLHLHSADDDLGLIPTLQTERGTDTAVSLIT